MKGWNSWKMTELRLLDRLYPIGGVNAVVALLPGRSKHAIRHRAWQRGLSAPDRSAFRHIDGAIA